MTRFTAIVTLIVTIGVACPSDASAGDITYFVEPVTLSDGDGYTIDGGWITTNGTLGPLSASDILDYEVTVAGGAFPFVFRPREPYSDVRLRGTVSATRVVIEVLHTNGNNRLMFADKGGK